MRHTLPLNCAYLKYLIKKKKYTFATISEALGVAESTFSAWITGKKQPSAKNFNKLCELLNVTPKALTDTTFQKVRQRCEELLFAYMEKDVTHAPTDKDFIQIMRVLGYDAPQKIEVESKEKVLSDAEKQLLGRSHGLTQSEDSS